MFYSASTRELVATALNRHEQWVCLYENFYIHYHAQGFFQVFGNEVFTSQAFDRFWDRYVPLSSRTHSIQRGEVGLSRRLIKGGFFASSIFSQFALSRALQAVMQSEMIEQQPIGNLLIDLYGNPSRLRSSTFERRKAMRQAIRKAEQTMQETNPTHGCGLVMHIILGAPVKRDLCYRGTHDISELVGNVNGFTCEEMAAMLTDLRKRGVPAGIRGLRHLLQDHGRI